jgi:hypothetical protein
MLDFAEPHSGRFAKIASHCLCTMYVAKLHKFDG